jgi:hypothetical protein
MIMYLCLLAFLQPLAVKLCTIDGHSTTLTEPNSKEVLAHGCQTTTFKFR